MVIRQARIYLAGGVSGTVVIVGAVVAFVVLVSLQTLRDWPLNGLGGNRSGTVQDSSVVARPAGSRGPTATAAPAPGSAAVAAPVNPNRSGAVATGDAGKGPGSPATVDPATRAPSSSPATELGGSESDSSGGPAHGGGSVQADGGGGSPSLPDSAAGIVNDTVAGVDSATGGAVGNAGVTEVTEDVVKGAPGPKSVVGRAVDNATEAVDGLPDGDR